MVRSRTGSFRQRRNSRTITAQHGFAPSHRKLDRTVKARNENPRRLNSALAALIMHP